MSLALPVLREMLNLGCNNQANILLTFQTYLELCEVHILKNISYKYCSELDIIYILATSEKEELYIPISVKKSISPEWISKVQRYIANDRESKDFIIVIRDSDSTCTMYKVSSGLVPPLSPQSSKRKKMIEEKKHFVEVEINKRLPQLYKEALQNATK